MTTFETVAHYKDVPYRDHYTGHEAVREFYDELLRALPDLQIEIQRRHAASRGANLVSARYEAAQALAEKLGQDFCWQWERLKRFDYQLQQPIPMFCIRFRMDEALMLLKFARVIVRPLRVLVGAAMRVAAQRAGVSRRHPHRPGR